MSEALSTISLSWPLFLPDTCFRMNFRESNTHTTCVCSKENKFEKKSLEEEKLLEGRIWKLCGLALSPKLRLHLLSTFFFLFYFDGEGIFDKKGCPNWVSLQFLLVLARCQSSDRWFCYSVSAQRSRVESVSLISWRAVIHKVYWKSSPFFFNNGIESVIDRKEPVLHFFFSTLLSSSIIIYLSPHVAPTTALDQTRSCANRRDFFFFSLSKQLTYFFFLAILIIFVAKRTGASFLWGERTNY